MRAPIIIGGGISGLSAAYYLGKAGVTPVLVEKEARLGGVIQTETVDGCLIEGGPDSFLAAKPAAVDLIRELGLGGDLISSNDHLRVTYILRGGRMVPMPDGLMMMVPTKILPLVTTRLLGWGTKLRMGLELFRRPPSKPLPDRSVAEFITDHYGHEALDYLTEPLLSGVYGGDPAHLSAASVLTRFVDMETSYGSLTRGTLEARRRAPPRKAPAPLFQTLKRGLGSWVAELEKRVPPPTRGEAETIERRGLDYRVRVSGQWMESDRLILACPSWQAARLVGTLSPALARLLASTTYSSSLTLGLGYRKADAASLPAGFGFLIPKRERERLVACTFVGTKFSHRVPDTHVLLRCFFGGQADEAILNESDEQLAAIARRELDRLFGLRADPLFLRISRWPKSMAQFTVGHQQRLKEIEARLAELPGLQVAGNAYTGIGISDCVRMGKEAAGRIAT